MNKNKRRLLIWIAPVTTMVLLPAHAQTTGLVAECFNCDETSLIPDASKPKPVCPGMKVKGECVPPNPKPEPDPICPGIKLNGKCVPLNPTPESDP